MQLFYNPDFDIQYPVLPEEEARHGLKVLRLGVGDTLHLTDGKGNLYTTHIESADPKKCHLSIVETKAEFGKRSYTIHLVVAPTKNADRTEWLVEKCVEFGVDQISFIACERSERKFFKTDRLEKIAVAAMKQSLKAYKPRISEIISFKEFVKNDHPGQKFIAHLEEGKRELLQHIIQRNGHYRMLIGPEGDFSPQEVQMAVKLGYSPVSLGESRLRTETAGIAACHIFNLLNS
jgi:16S rRNA (uracil1498-N3)-methyltransferase